MSLPKVSTRKRHGLTSCPLSGLLREPCQGDQQGGRGREAHTGAVEGAPRSLFSSVTRFPRTDCSGTEESWGERKHCWGGNDPTCFSGDISLRRAEPTAPSTGACGRRFPKRKNRSGHPLRAQGHDALALNQRDTRDTLEESADCVAILSSTHA